MPSESDQIHIEMSMSAASICCGCHQAKELFTLRQGVSKCSDCICNQIGRSTMDLFRKGLKSVPAPVHVLVVVTGDSSSTFLYDLLKARLNTSLQGRSAVVRQLECLRQDKLSLTDAVNEAKSRGLNCVVLGDDVSTVALATLAAFSSGLPDRARIASTDDFDNYGVAVLRPVRQCLVEETEFYCRQHGLEFDNTTRTLDRAFSHEQRLLDAVLREGNGGVPFAVQKLAERLTPVVSEHKCPLCGLPNKDDQVCEICKVLERA